MVAAGVIDKDRGFNGIVRKTGDADGIQLAVGIQGPEAGAIEHEGSELSNVELGLIHEFGAPLAGIPERSAFRATFDAKIESWNSLFVKAAQKIYSTDQESPIRLVGIIGEKVKADIINTINQGIPPELQQATIDRKGSSKPWIDTGQLKGAITWKVRR